MRTHPAADLFPPMSDAEFDGLVADIAAHGVREPIWLKDGALIDGRHRVRAVERLALERPSLKITCPTRDFKGTDVLAFVVSLNLKRRHLDESQRAMVAAKMANLPRGSNQHASIEAPSQADAAEMLNVSRSAVQRAASVRESGDPSLVAAVESGSVSVSAAAQVATLPKEQQADIVATGPDEVREVAKTMRTGPHVANNSGNNEWYTPLPYIAAARETMDSIDVDPASSVVANRIVQAEQFYTMEMDGLKQEWIGNVWLNPPYSQPQIGQFIDRLIAQIECGNVLQACVLVNNATETQWFQSLLELAASVCFLRGRVKFLDESGTPANTPLQGQAILYFGAETDAFAKAFIPLGQVLFALEIAA